MDFVLKLHPETERILIEAQKDFLLTMNSKDSHLQAFPYYPLYAKINSENLNTENKASLKKSIEKISLKDIEIIKIENEFRIVCPVKICFSNKKESIEYIILGTYRGNKKIQVKKDFFAEPKSFMLCQMIKNGFETQWWNPIWIKCK